jgi:ABC-type antimicrobial peptide transport system permease subunit
MDSKSMFNAFRGKVRELDAAMPIYEMKTLERRLDETLSTERLIAVLSAAFGILATVLAALGLYGVMAFMVARRTKEIGLRMALGAPQGLVVWMVMRETLVVLGAGLAVGIPATLALSRYVSTQLFGVKATDFVSAGAALLILTLVAGGAGFLPARRASTIDPIQALRYE